MTSEERKAEFKRLVAEAERLTGWTPVARVQQLINGDGSVVCRAVLDLVEIPGWKEAAEDEAE